MFFWKKRKTKSFSTSKSTTLDALRAELKDKVVESNEQEQLKGGLQQHLINPLDNWNDSTDVLPQ